MTHSAARKSVGPELMAEGPGPWSGGSNGWLHVDLPIRAVRDLPTAGSPQRHIFNNLLAIRAPPGYSSSKSELSLEIAVMEADLVGSM